LPHAPRLTRAAPPPRSLTDAKARRAQRGVLNDANAPAGFYAMFSGQIETAEVRARGVAAPAAARARMRDAHAARARR
jgi:hypothetical protein